LREGCARGVMDESAERSREYRTKRYWVRKDVRQNAAGPRIQPAHMTGPLVGYDLMALARLSTGFRRQ